jgi:hypothetical protein
MNVANGRVRNSHNFRDDVVRHVDSAGLFRISLDGTNMQRRPHQPTVTQGNLGDAVPNAGNLRFDTRADMK